MKRRTPEYWKQQFITRACVIHDKRYTYEEVDYVKSCIKVCIRCPTHGVFEQRPNDHLRGNGCPTCHFEKIANIKRSSYGEFVEKAMTVHDDYYNYPKFEYKNAISKVPVECPIHGIFYVTPDKHLSGVGCVKCSNNLSRGERKIQNWLLKNNIVYEREKIFDDLYGATKNSRLRYDFWLPEYNTLIEYDGEHHFSPVQVKGRLSTSQASHQHKRTLINDELKNQYAEDHNITLHRIKFDQYKNIDQILSEIFKL